MEVQSEQIPLVVVYRKLVEIGNFINNLIHEIICLPLSSRTLVIGDFIVDQMLHENSEKFQLYLEFEFYSQFQLCQRCNDSIHTLGGILDLVFDSNHWR